MDKSQIRKQLLESQKEVAGLLQIFMQRPSLIRGSVYTLRRKCGKANCRCQDGHLHESWVLSIPEKGRKRMRTVPKGHRLKWQQMADNYRCFRRARTRLIKLVAEILKLVDELERERTVPPPLSKGTHDAADSNL